jgi:hypothetical protein
MAPAVSGLNHPQRLFHARIMSQFAFKERPEAAGPESRASGFFPVLENGIPAPKALHRVSDHPRGLTRFRAAARSGDRDSICYPVL